MRYTTYIIFLIGLFRVFAQNPTTGNGDWVVSNITANNELEYPNEITYGPDNYLWITERVGKKVVKVHPDGGSKIIMLDLSTQVSQSSGQDGLLGMAIHPDLYTDLNTSNNYVYLAYTYESSGYKIKIVRCNYNVNTGLLESTGILTIIDDIDASNDHNSGRLKIGPDLKLYYTIGDQGANKSSNACKEIRAQFLPINSLDHSDYKGKVLRLNLDGSIPVDNPILNDVKSHVYSYGHRNAQGLAFSKNGNLYSSEHGDIVDDEINVIKSGRNYGWPLISGYYDDKLYHYCNWSSLGVECADTPYNNSSCPDGVIPLLESSSGIPENFEEPIGTFNSSVSELPNTSWGARPTVAPSSIEIYEEGMIPGWNSSLLVPTLKRGTIFRVALSQDGSTLKNGEYEEFHSSNDRYRDLAIGPDGVTIYAITDNSGGTTGPSGTTGVSLENPGVIVKLEYTGINPGITKWDGASWNNGLPNKTFSAEINGNYDAVINGNIEALDLTINSNLNFDIQSQGSIIVHGDLTINGILTIGDQESLVMYDNNATIIGKITKLESSTDRTNVNDFTYWSSPVISTDAVIGTVFSGVDSNRIFYYDQSKSIETDSDQPGYWDVWVSAMQNMTMTAGKGFAAEGNNDGIHNISFTGKPNNGNIYIPIVYQNQGNNYNLIGNPYPSAIDISKFFTANNSVFEAYLWTHSTSIIAENGDFTGADYATINRTGSTAATPGGVKPMNNIGSSQGFMIAATGDDSVIFTNNMRLEGSNDQFFKSSNSRMENSDNEEVKDKIWLNLTTDRGGFNQILIGFKGGLSSNIDDGYDTKRISGSNNPISFYSVLEKGEYVIQGQRSFDKEIEIKLGFNTNVSPRKFKINIDRTAGVLEGEDIYLVDNTLKVTHHLSDSDYEFEETEIGEFPDRFTMYFYNNTLNIDDLTLKNDLTIISDFGDMTIASNHTVNDIKAYDILGKLLIHKTPYSNNFMIKSNQIKSGTILLIVAKLDNGAFITKKIII